MPAKSLNAPRKKTVGHVSVEHAFQAEGEYKITEVIETDDLASPKIEATREVPIGLLPLEVELTAPSRLTAKQAGKFEAAVVDPDEAAPHLTYVWKFGDGTESRDGPTTEKAIADRTRVRVAMLPMHRDAWKSKTKPEARGEATADIVVSRTQEAEAATSTAATYQRQRPRPPPHPPRPTPVTEWKRFTQPNWPAPR